MAAQLPPKAEWINLSLMQLYELKSNMLNIYYDARSAGATYANQYLNLVTEVDAYIAGNIAKTAADKEAEEKAIEQAVSSDV